MSKVILGRWDDGKRCDLDVGKLVVSRMLIQAESGGGKSYLLRKTLEITGGLLQQIIIDPEGEFASLREKHDLIYVAGEGGDVLADPRTAGLLALRLLETQASAVIDLSEVNALKWKPFMRNLCEALINAPKKLRHPLLFAVDEIQIFAPEKGTGEAESLGALIEIARRGRKRGICLVGATQRLSSVHKDCAYGLKNKLIGATSGDLDVKRAAFELGLTPKDALAQLRPLEAGHFYAYGPALGQKSPRLLVCGKVETTHPEAGGRAIALPKPSDAVKALLPKLADLPREAEERAQTIDSLRKQLTEAQRELKAAQRGQPKAAAAAPAGITKAELTAAYKAGELKGQAVGQVEGEIAGMEKALVRIVGMRQAMTVDIKKYADEHGKALRSQLVNVRKLVTMPPDGPGANTRKLPPAATAPPVVPAKAGNGYADLARKFDKPFESVRPQVEAMETRGAEQRVLNNIAEIEMLGRDVAERPLLALMCGWTHPRNKTFTNALGAAKSAGLIEYLPGSQVRLTEAGRAQARAPDRPRTPEELQERVVALIGGPSAKILQALVETGEEVSREDLVARAGYEHVRNKTFTNTLGRLRSLGLIEYRPESRVIASPVLFME